MSASLPTPDIQTATQRTDASGHKPTFSNFFISCLWRAERGREELTEPGEATPGANNTTHGAPARTCVGLGRGCKGRDCSRFMHDFYMVMDGCRSLVAAEPRTDHDHEVAAEPIAAKARGASHQATLLRISRSSGEAWSSTARGRYLEG
jgi:hypothetical protein